MTERKCRPKQMETACRQAETRLKAREEEKHGGNAGCFFS